MVGVWVAGVASAADPLVWGACLKFQASGQLRDKALQADGAFLLLLYQTGGGGDLLRCLRASTSFQSLP